MLQSKTFITMKCVRILFLCSTILAFACVRADKTYKFFYFAYGSNLLAKRLHINVPSAELYTIAKLQNYRLEFTNQSPLWNGAVATVCKEDGHAVWGALWAVSYTDMDALNNQEGVGVAEFDMYYVKDVKVKIPGGRVVTARTYIQNANATLNKIAPGEKWPMMRRPSITYRKVIITGALEVGLPSRYIIFLKSFPHNGRLASETIRRQLGEP